MLRVLHTSDWHLGHQLHDVSREDEHQAFFAWLLEVLAAHEVDALLVAGDVFDTANPGARAQQLYYDFLMQAQRQRPGLDVVIIGGNHDSPARLDAPRDLLAALGLRVIGGLPRCAGGEGQALDPERLLVPLHNGAGEVEVLCLAMPFLRPADLPGPQDPASLRAGVAARYQEALDLARAQRRRDQALLVTGHCYAVGVKVSELSERRIHCGGEEALPVELFGSDADYVALGHLHRAQAVAGCEHVRYSGAPLALSLPEFAYRHQVRLVDFEAGQLVRQELLEVPRHTELRVVDLEAGEAIEAACALLPEAEAGARSTAAAPWPFLEVQIRLEPGAVVPRDEIEAALEGKACRLLKISVRRSQLDSEAKPSLDLDAELSDVDPAEVFAARFAQKFPDRELSPELGRAFASLVEAAGAEEVPVEELQG